LGETPHTKRYPLLTRIIRFFQYPEMEYSTIYMAISGNNTIKAKRIEWLFVLIFHSIIFCLIPLSIISLTVFIPNSGFSFYSGEIREAIVYFYLFSIIFAITGLYWEKITDKFLPNQSLPDRHIGRLCICYFPQLGLTFILGLIGASWIVISPLFILLLIELILTFPTNRNWKNWL
jgi:hypothetical protein